VAWRFQPGEPLDAEFRRVALEEMAEVQAELGAADVDRDAAVHHARRSFKKIRALVRLARPSLGELFAGENRRWRDAGRRLSASRDATVLLGTFDAVAARCGDELRADQLARLRAALAKSVPVTPGGDNAADIAAVEETLRAAVPAIRELPWPRGTGELARGLRDAQARLRRNWKAARRAPHSEALHDWRKRVKDASAQLGLFRAVLPGHLKACREQAKFLGEALGEEHDLALLCEQLTALPPGRGAKRSCECLLQVIQGRRNDLRQSAFELGEVISDLSPKALANEIVERWERAAAAAAPASRRAARRA